jgi:hypothetical protein
MKIQSGRRQAPEIAVDGPHKGVNSVVNSETRPCLMESARIDKTFPDVRRFQSSKHASEKTIEFLVS